MALGFKNFKYAASESWVISSDSTHRFGFVNTKILKIILANFGTSSLKKDWWKNNNNSTKNLLLVKQSKFSKNYENEKKSLLQFILNL